MQPTVRDDFATSGGELRASRIVASRNHVLERIAAGAPLVEVLTLLTTACERVMPDTLCSVLLLDAATGTLHHGAAPSLPASYCQAIDGAAIGPAMGSCGTAAYLGERVIVADVCAHPYWAAFWPLAVAANLRACWSEPIRSTRGEILGTFAMYYREVREPDSSDLEFIATSAHIAGVAIERARIERELEQHREHLEELVATRTAELERVNAELRQALLDVKVLRGMLPVCATCRRVRDDSGYWEQIEAYVADRSEAVFTHGICPECADALYPRGSRPELRRS